jgi:glycosyltransferase involved in cell wall biosynthesis
MRILYIHTTQVPPPLDTRRDRFFLLSETLEGDVLHPIWFKNQEEVEAELGPGSYPIYTSGKFRYHWFLAHKADGGTRSRLAQFWFYLRNGVRLHRQQAFDCVVAYSHMGPGVMAAVVKLLTRGKLVIEVATTPRLLGLTNRPRPNFSDRVRRLYSDLCLHLSVGSADRVHLLYPAQLAGYPLLKNVKSSVFHEFFSASMISAHGAVANRPEGEERYVLQVGAPWYLKGVDRLVAAFKRLAPDFPDVKLKLVGWYLERERKELEGLRGGVEQIELVRAMANPPTMEMMSRCLVLVHPSRCEGGPSRVVTEALAAGVPVIGSDVAGIPYLIRQGESGFVVPGDDIAELEKRLRQLLADPELRRRLGVNGYALAHAQLTERVYVERFSEMIRAAIRGAG